MFPARQTVMHRVAWIWLAGCFAWTIDLAVSIVYGNRLHAELAFLLALLFGIAYAFYRKQGRS